MWESLDTEVDVTATGLPVLSTAAGFSVLSVKMVDGCSRFKVGRIQASIMQIRLEYNSSQKLRRLIHFTVQFSPTFSMYVVGKVL